MPTTALARRAATPAAFAPRRLAALAPRETLVVAVLCTIGLVLARTAGAQDVGPRVPASTGASRQSLDDAWWTGPVAASSASTLPRGHVLIEPYLYDVITPRAHVFGSRTYLIYGLVDRLSVAVIPTAGMTRPRGEAGGGRPRLGDATLMAQYRLTQFREGSWLPTTAVVLQETVPTGTYDALGDRPSDASGGGSYVTSIGINTQRYFWLRNGRLLRSRLNVAQSVSRVASVDGVSVYGTTSGFRGSARPGASLVVDGAAEYSLTKRTALALEGVFEHAQPTSVAGAEPGGRGSATESVDVRFRSGRSTSLGVIPAVEYSWTANTGVLLGVRSLRGSHGTRSVTPVVALNVVR